MTWLGWLFLSISNLTVLSLLGYCFWKLFSLPSPHMHAPLDMDTGDLDETDEEFLKD